MNLSIARSCFKDWNTGYGSAIVYAIDSQAHC